MKSKEEFYKYGESLGIKINDLQRLKMLAEKLYFHVDGFEEEISESKRHFIQGYTQCQKDMADYIFEVARQFHRLGKYSGHTSDTHFTDIYEETINSLNKQDNG